MKSRKITKDMISFLRRELKEKGAEYGELYKFKKHALVKKGLPNLPNLTIFREPWLSYLIVIKSGSEFRFYFFDSQGVLHHGDSYKQEGEVILEELKKKTKKLSRYPIEKKEPTIVDITHKFDKKFSKIWKEVTNYLGVEKKIRQKRPVIRVSSMKYESVFQSKITDQYIHIPLRSEEQIASFFYFSFYYCLPKSIKLNEKVAQSIAWRMLISYKKKSVFISEKSIVFSSRFFPLVAWNQYSPKEIHRLLTKLSTYHTARWDEKDLLSLVDLSQEELPSITRQNLPKIFCRLAEANNNISLYLLATVLAFPFDGTCEGFTGKIGKEQRLYDWLTNRKVKEIYKFLKSPPTSDLIGLHKAVRESLEFLHANVLEIDSSSQNKSEFIFKNTSDLFVLLSGAKKVFPDGKEVSFPFKEMIIAPYSTIVVRFSLSDLTENQIISLKYHLSLEKEIKRLFTGKIII